MDNEKTQIQKLYDKIPSMECLEGCHECCDNHIQFAPEEGERCGGFPYTSRECPYLDEKGRCTVHQKRPFVCRIYGNSEIMPCPHGCKGDTTLTAEETMELVREYLRLKKEQEESVAKEENQ